ncbi:MAG: hypothetical protein WCD38_13770 [Candidatus Tumulicola sp.]
MNDLALVCEVDARRALREHRLRLCVLVPFGGWIGCGKLRVLRLQVHDDESATLTAGYESYRRALPQRRPSRDGRAA